MTSAPIRDPLADHLITALDALREGYQVYPVVDAIGGTSLEAHRAGLDRVVQAGACGGGGLRESRSYLRDADPVLALFSAAFEDGQEISARRPAARGQGVTRARDG